MPMQWAFRDTKEIQCPFRRHCRQCRGYGVRLEALPMPKAQPEAKLGVGSGAEAKPLAKPDRNTSIYS